MLLDRRISCRRRPLRSVAPIFARRRIHAHAHLRHRPAGGNRKGYAGYENDGVLANSGLYHVRCRPLQTIIGSWIRREPNPYLDGPNLYSYVGDAPLGYVDPTGEQGIPIAIPRPIVPPRILPLEPVPPIPVTVPLPETGPIAVPTELPVSVPLDDPYETDIPIPATPEGYRGKRWPPECQYLTRKYHEWQKELRAWSGIKDCSFFKGKCDELSRYLDLLRRVHGYRIHMKACLKKYNLPTDPGHDQQIQQYWNRMKRWQKCWEDLGCGQKQLQIDDLDRMKWMMEYGIWDLIEQRDLRERQLQEARDRIWM